MIDQLEKANKARLNEQLARLEQEKLMREAQLRKKAKARNNPYMDEITDF